MLPYFNRNYRIKVNIITGYLEWVIQEKTHTPPTDGMLKILPGGGSRTLEIWAGEGGLGKNFKLRVIFNQTGNLKLFFDLAELFMFVSVQEFKKFRKRPILFV